MARNFEARPAVRESTPLLLGLIGPSGSGKTFSALRLATGIQRVSGGDIYAIDTEARRMLHYADRFKFQHVPFGAPFGPLDYLDAINYCLQKGAKTIIVDSMSHEHEGPGGVLEQHAKETTRLAKLWGVKESVAQMAAWAEPKQARRRLINSILQMSANFIFCFRAKEKIKIKKGEDPVPLGFMPQAGEEFVFEMVLKCLLLPGANGVPTWKSEEVGEKMMIKLPEQFKGLFEKPTQLSEDLGQRLAEWALGSAAAKRTDPKELLASYAACSDPATLRSLEDERKRLWSDCSKDVKAELKSAADAAAARIKEAEERARVPADPPTDGDDADPPEDTSKAREEFEAGFKPTAT